MCASVHEHDGVAATHAAAWYISQIYRIEIGKTPQKAELTAVKAKPTLLIAVLEDHTKQEPVNVVNKLVVVRMLVEGADIYSSPVISPNGKKLAWLQWHHPDMSWEGSELMLADFIVLETSCKVENAKKISGERGEISISQPQWASDDTLVLLNDSSGFVNLGPTPLDWSNSLRAYC
ncbi:hypothetical protein K439DRAFT_1612554 [Ramaria rubella]|nr:hypothetical protein K439DRAFT_1612554 [Ramaria rubella]